MIHVAEMENTFCTALKGVLTQNCNSLNCELDLDIIGALIRNNNLEDGMSNKSAMFLDISSFPAGSIKGKRDDNNLSIPTILNPSEMSFIQDDYQISFEDLFTNTRSLLSASGFSSYQCHPAMIPNHIFLLSSLPRNGAAGKIDRRALNILATNEIKKKIYVSKDSKMIKNAKCLDECGEFLCLIHFLL